MTDVAKVGEILWKKIHDHQAAGGVVRNEKMAKRFGGIRGLVFLEEDAPIEAPVCLQGLFGGGLGPRTVIRAFMKAVGCTEEEAIDLEDGFEGWTDGNRREDSPFYKLGREIGQRLEDEEALVFD